MDTQTQASIQDVVRNLTQDGVMFSAYDVTRIIRAKGVPVYHSQVRSIVHSFYLDEDMDEDYIRSPLALNGRAALVYHHSMDDVNEYDQDALKPKDATPAVSSVTDDDEDDKVPLSADNRGRVHLGADLMRKLYVKRGDVVYAFSDIDGELSITDDGLDLDRGYIVDKDGAIRIGRSVILAAGLTAGNLNASYSNDVITITN